MEEGHSTLAQFTPRHEFFVGIDSDGCAFDSMEIKHKECFIPNTVKHWGLQCISKYVREAAEFVNLYSHWRGTNRWPALVMVFDLLRERPEVQARGCPIPQAEGIRAFIKDGGYPLSHQGMMEYARQHPSTELETALAWSAGVDASIGDIVHGLMPFPYVRESLKALQEQADIAVVSATPMGALVREWQAAGIAAYAQVIAGQELGTKAEQLQAIAAGRYAPNHLLMIGDAIGDLKAARSVEALFFPIHPGQEEESWRRFYEEGVHRFLAGEFAGEYESALIAEFERRLPETPPWLRS